MKAEWTNIRLESTVEAETLRKVKIIWGIIFREKGGQEIPVIYEAVEIENGFRNLSRTAKEYLVKENRLREEIRYGYLKSGERIYMLVDYPIERGRETVVMDDRGIATLGGKKATWVELNMLEELGRGLINH